ncbi:TetR family transcriptional regulator [Streptomyces agglomeratus]|uniref:TetR family transcriptional regulator n=1 Tax=Streptomyces agglomeratus TaxID=285458 RepID=A0A1E5PDM6_9ACTN|nr:TetR/AcrR family transcriptional regulator [Streptomyces agglomeratus]OEJ27642.1 TetR family transcriptional regulator [Streptomyces agglomeratus]OEJ50825.1 TetR family transcriptional regulator [Streptomyces agglomeratus]OEJ58188.1 TetR family transcriptional regulator [Streptomyces agglomeratus]
MGTVPRTNSLRRAPVQQRSADRLARILDACAQLLDESGYEQLSTRAVAARAGVPIGSVYRFFGNKRAMADALAQRNLDHYAERIGGRISAMPGEDWRGAIDAVLDEYVTMKRTVPGFRLVDFGVQIPVGDRAADSGGADIDYRVTDRLTDLLAAHLGRTPDPALRRTVLVAVEAADALLQLAFRVGPSGDPDLIAETRAVLHAYLARIFD